MTTPMQLALATINRAVKPFHPSSMPAMSRIHYRRELAAWALLPVAIGAMEGSVGGVIAKYAFAGSVPDTTLNASVAVLSAAPAFANVMSFVWAALSHGRDKIRTMTTLQLLTLVCVVMVAFAPFNGAGMIVLLIAMIGARVFWSGVVVLRSTVWGANYPRAMRATMAGRLATVQALIMATVAIGIGAAVEIDRDLIRVAYPLAALIGGAGVFMYSRMRMRGHRALLRAEQDVEDRMARSFNPLRWREILRDDVRYRHYQTCMFVFGFGNLMVSAPLIIMLKDRFASTETVTMLITATIPLILMSVSVPLWSRLLDRTHIIAFRALHSWTFVGAIGLILVAGLTGWMWILFASAVLQGVAFGGGVLGWNLGHHDFAPAARVSQYMGVHVTLTGIRGMTGPLVAVSAYQAFEFARPGAGVWVFAISLAISLLGAIGFVHLRHRFVR